MNTSKSNLANKAQWEKWRRSGAIGTLLDAETLAIRREPLPITAIGVHYNPDGTVNKSTLSIGNRIVAEGDGWQTSVPEAYAVVPGEPFRPGDNIRTKDLPVGSMTISQAFRK